MKDAYRLSLAALLGAAVAMTGSAIAQHQTEKRDLCVEKISALDSTVNDLIRKLQPGNPSAHGPSGADADGAKATQTLNHIDGQLSAIELKLDAIETRLRR